MKIIQSPPQKRTGKLIGHRQHLTSRLSRISKPAAALALGGVAMIAIGGMAFASLGALALGAIAIGGYWKWAGRNSIWAHVLVDTDDIVFSLVFPIPVALLRWGLELSSVPNDAVDLARLILEEPVLLDALRDEAIETSIDSGGDHIEVVIGPRRKQWRIFQFKPIHTFSQKKSFHKTTPISEEIDYVR